MEGFWLCLNKLFIHVCYLCYCTAQVVGSDDVAASDNIGVLNGTPG